VIVRPAFVQVIVEPAVTVIVSALNELSTAVRTVPDCAPAASSPAVGAAELAWHWRREFSAPILRAGGRRRRPPHHYPATM
jgi:hypothetical protein